MRKGMEQVFIDARTGDIAAGGARGAARAMRPVVEAQREAMQFPSELQGPGGPLSLPGEAQEPDEEQLRIMQDALLRFDSLSASRR